MGFHDECITEQMGNEKTRPLQEGRPTHITIVIPQDGLEKEFLSHYTYMQTKQSSENPLV
jgi:hypothetical protein